MSNTLTGLIPTLYDALDIVARELVGFTPAVFRNSSAERAALNETITYPVTPAATTGDITPGQTPPDDGDQMIGNDSITISKSKYSPVRWNGEEQKGVGNSGVYNVILRDQFVQSMRALVNLIEADLFTTAKGGASRAYGTAAATPFATAADLTDLAQTRKILEDNGMWGQDMHLVLNTTAAAKLRGTQSNLFKVNEAGDSSLLRDGSITTSPLMGFALHESGQIVSHTKGTGASYVTSGSTAVGVQDIALVTGTGTVLAGDVVTFAADANNKYVIKTGVAAPGTITLGSPGARVVIATGNALTVGGTYTGNFAFARNAIHLVTRAPAMPVDGNGKAMDMADDVMVITDPLSGISFQVALYRLYRRVRFEVSIAWGFKAAKNDGIVTLLG